MRLGRFGVPAAALLGHLLFLLESRQDAVQVVLLDAHLGGELRDRDAGLALDERERLGGTSSAAFAAAGAFCCFARFFRGGFGGGAAGAARAFAGGDGGRGADGRAPYACERAGGGLEAVVLVDQRLQLFEPLGDLLALLIKEVGHVTFHSSIPMETFSHRRDGSSYITSFSHPARPAPSSGRVTCSPRGAGYLPPGPG